MALVIIQISLTHCTNSINNNIELKISNTLYNQFFFNTFHIIDYWSADPAAGNPRLSNWLNVYFCILLYILAKSVYIV